ncbi:MAG: hypothetical protein N3B11_05425, partial [Coriobacteriia bacterium]|nr:hypothetical protein [Coriobacteriia bacterium]
MSRFFFLPVASVLVDSAEEFERIAGPWIQVTADLGGQRIEPEQAARTRPLAVLVLTGGTERVVLDLVARRQAAGRSEPLLLIAHPGNNSLPAALETLAALRSQGVPGRVVFLASPDHGPGRAALEDAIADVSVADALSQARIGVVGEPSDWLVASTPDAGCVRAVWGPVVVPVPIERLFEAMSAVDGIAGVREAERFVSGAAACVEPSEHDLADAGRVVAALRSVVNAERLDAVTVRCFDLVLRSRTSGCLALASLIDEGIIAGCEGDLPSTVAMLWARLLTGETPWMANPARIDEQRNELWLAHCTVPLSVVEEHRLRSHFESGLGVGIQGRLAEGPVTLVRIGGPEMTRLWVAEGAVVATGDADD